MTEEKRKRWTYRVLVKVFRTTSMDLCLIAECRYWFGLLEMESGDADCHA